jgi:hypothetical protein
MRDPAHSKPRTLVHACALLAAFALAGCGGKEAVKRETFKPETPFSKRMPGAGETVCWSVRRAILSQGYMLDRSADSVVMTGVKEYQPDEETNETLRLQATCVDNKDGTSTVFATATREMSKMQKSHNTFSAGVSLATVMVPMGSEKSLRVMSRKTIQDAGFYDRFYTLVQRFSAEEPRKPPQPPSKAEPPKR